MKRCALLLLAGCAVTIPKPTPVDAQRAGTTVEALDAGRSLYVKRCGGCHSLYAPSEYAPSVWPDKVAAMREKAKLGADDEAAIVRYLSALSTRR